MQLIRQDASKQASFLGDLQRFVIRPRNLASPQKAWNLDALVLLKSGDY